MSPCPTLTTGLQKDLMLTITIIIIMIIPIIITITMIKMKMMIKTILVYNNIQ